MRDLQSLSDLYVFIHDDASIINSVDEPGSTTSNPGQLNFLRVGLSRKYEERRCLLKIDLPDLTDLVIDEIQLCMYQYYTDIGASSSDRFSLRTFSQNWSENDSTFPEEGDVIAENFRFSSTEEGKECISIQKPYFDTFLGGNGVILTADTSGNRKERYFMSSEYTSAVKNIYEPGTDSTYHPHWKISLKEFAELPTAAPDPSSGTPADSTLETDRIGSNQNNISPNTNRTTIMIGILLFVTFCALLLGLILFVRRNKGADRERIFRTFLSEDGISRRGKYSFNSVNSSNKAEPGNSGRSLKWIENVQLDDGGGDMTVCNKIDERIDSAVIFPPVEKSVQKPVERPKKMTTRKRSAPTPKQKNPGIPFDHTEKVPNNYRSRNIPQQYRQKNYQGTRLNEMKSTDIRKKRNNTSQRANQQESIERMRERINARKMALLRSHMQTNDSNSGSNNEYSYPSLISSYPSSDDESTPQREKERKNNCCDEVVEEFIATKKDAKCIWEENFGDPKSSTLGSTTNPSSTLGSSTYPSTFAESLTARYSSSDESTSFPTYDSTNADSHLYSHLSGRYSSSYRY